MQHRHLNHDMLIPQRWMTLSSGASWRIGSAWRKRFAPTRVVTDLKDRFDQILAMLESA